MQNLTQNKQKGRKENWYLVDADNVRLGVLSSKVANVLLGKSRIDRVDHQHNGNKVVIINADKIAYYPKKAKTKIYYRHSGYQGGLKSISLGDQLTKDARKVIYDSISGMLPKNKLRDRLLGSLYIYNGAEHKHSAQTPTSLDLKSDKQ